MKYLWIFLVLCAGSAVGQNAYGPDFLNLHCTRPDPLAQTLFNIQPRPGLVPDVSANGNVVLYCDSTTGAFKASFNGSQYSNLFPAAVDVAAFRGSDWCAQVNAADTALSGVTATLLVSQAMAGLPACNTTISLSSNHTLSFGQGTYNLGTLNSRTGILIGHAVSNVGITGLGTGKTTILYTSFNVGANNLFSWGTAITLGNVTTCAGASDAASYIRISDVTIHDLNTTTAFGPAANPSAIAGACLHDITIERDEFTDIKGNSGTGLSGNWNTFTGGRNLYIRNNLYDGDSAGGWGEFSADNSNNWTDLFFTGNNVYGYKCAGIGGASNFRESIIGNHVDLSLVASNCAAIAAGQGSEGGGGHVMIANNTVFLSANTPSSPGPAISIQPGLNVNTDMPSIVQGNYVYTVNSGSQITYGIWVSGAGASGFTPPALIHNNFMEVSNGVSIQGGNIGDLDVSGNTVITPPNFVSTPFFFSCASNLMAIQSLAVVKLHDNHLSQNTAASAAYNVFGNCANATFSSRQFLIWNNTMLDNSLTAQGNAETLGGSFTVSWTPGTIPAGGQSAQQTTLVNQVIVGDKVEIVPDPATTPITAGLLMTGYVSSASGGIGTIKWLFLNNSSAAITINGGNPVNTFIKTERLPQGAPNLAFTQGTLPATYNHSGTLQTGVHIVEDTCTLGTSCAVTLTGSSVFTSSTSYQCTVTDQTNINAAKFAPTSGTAFTLTGNATDVLSYICVGD